MKMTFFPDSKTMVSVDVTRVSVAKTAVLKNELMASLTETPSRKEETPATITNTLVSKRKTMRSVENTPVVTPATVAPRIETILCVTDTGPSTANTSAQVTKTKVKIDEAASALK